MVTESFLLICYQRFLRESALPLPAITRIRFRLVTLLEQLWSQSTCQPQSTRNIFRNRLFLYCCNERSFSLQFLGTIWIDTSHSWTQCCFISITVNMKKIFSYSTDPRMAFLVDARKKKIGLLYLIHDSFHDWSLCFVQRKEHFINSNSVFWV